MKIAVIIAFRGEESLLAWALAGYAEQELAAGMEVTVWVGGDGVDAEVMPRVEAGGGGLVRGRSYPRCGAGAVRNRLIAEAAEWGAEMVIFGNADARPAADFVRGHVERLRGLPGGSMVLGPAPWEKPERPSVLDALLAETPMVFFYGSLKTGEWYDFRHAWTLNLSARMADLRKASGEGPFVDAIRPVYYEDLVMGWRVMGARKGICFDEGPRVTHRHRTTLEQYLNREELLGVMAPVVARHSPEVFGTLWGGKTAEELAREFRTWVAMDGASHKWIYERLAGWCGQPEAALGAGEGRERTLMTIYQMHVPLKRLAFRLGFLRGLELVEDGRWEERKAVGLWKKVVGVGQEGTASSC